MNETIPLRFGLTAVYITRDPVEEALATFGEQGLIDDEAEEIW